jgi:multidrug efflux pump subunit AcrB
MHSVIEWFARNEVAANLLMVFIIAAGLFALPRIPVEVFPEFDLDVVSINVPYRGATPTEVEEGVVIRLEEAIQDLEGIDRIESTASEGNASVRVEVETGYAPRELADDIRARVDGLTTLPTEAERPVVQVAQRRRDVITVAVTAATGERELRELGERVRDELLALPDITQVELDAVRAYELAIEVSEDTLRAYDLTFDELARAVDAASLDLSAGRIRTPGGEILLRTTGQAYTAEDFAELPILTRDDGVRLTLGEIATIRDGFEEDPVITRFNGERAVLVEVFRVGDQNAITIAQSVKDYIADSAARLPPGVSLGYWRDSARIVEARLDTLLKSALQGGLMVFLLLALFLRPGVALWVCVGVPVAFLGAIALMPWLGVTINILSLFAFILVLGVVVDDAIVTGESIYSRLAAGADSGLDAAIGGTHAVAVPVTFGILTTIAAFVPLATVGGIMGNFLSQIPLIVIPVLLFSLVESKLILPTHLKGLKPAGQDQPGPLLRVQRRVAAGLEWSIRRLYAPALAAALRQRYVTLAVFLGIGFLVVSLIAGGVMRIVFFPRIESELARANVVMPVGTPIAITAGHVERMTAAAEALQDDYRDPATGEPVIRNILSVVGRSGRSSGGHIGRVRFEIQAREERTLEVGAGELVREWRERIGTIPGAEELSFRSGIGRVGDPIDVQLTGVNFSEVRAMADAIKARLATYPAVFDLTDTFEDGKQELQLTIKPEAEVLGLTLDDLARQVRQAFFGREIERIQRGREDVRVMLRYPPEERRAIADLQSMRIRTPAGAAVPFAEVATVEFGRSPAAIERIDRARTLNIRADVDKQSTDIDALRADLAAFVETASADYPTVRYTLEGEARERRESTADLYRGAAFVLLVIYVLLAIPFRSYLQPLIVMLVIPFGVVGAILGHFIMSMPLSFFSFFGMLALTGVVVNDSLVLVDYVNRRRREGVALFEAVTAAGAARFRPILLTSLTTFAGLMPLIFEQSTQAQFLIPMAVSLGFGILFATFITLLLVPINYLVLEDLRRVAGRGRQVLGRVVS